MICSTHLGQAPDIVIEEHFAGSGGPFTYVPMHMHYMLTEVLKNACRAVVERHHRAGNKLESGKFPAIKVQVAHGSEDVIFKVSDEGGGIPRAGMQDIWKFMHSTFRGGAWDRLRDDRQGKELPSRGDSIANPLQRQAGVRSNGGLLAGYGVGLTLSRLYARYFGGDLQIVSLDGHGTDVHLHVSRLGTACENLPRGVLHSPGMRDSSLPGENGEEQFLISAREFGFLRKELKTMRSEKDQGDLGKNG